MGGLAKQRQTAEKGIFLRPNGNIVIDKVIRGSRIYENLGPVTFEMAKDVLAKRRTQLLEGEYFPGMVSDSRSLTVGSALNDYWTEHLQHMKSACDAKYLLTAIDEVFGSMQVRQINRAHVEKYARERLAQHRKIRYKDARGKWQVREGKPISKRCVRAELEALRAAINWAVENNRIKINPLPKFSNKKHDFIRLGVPQKIMLDKEKRDGKEWQRLYNAACDDLKPILLTLYHTAMRPNEVFHMQWSWINEFDRVIIIPAEAEKTATSREIPISEELSSLLQSLPKKDGLVFPSPVTGKARTGIKKAFDAALQRAGLTGRGFTPYALRRTRLTIWDEIDHIGAMSAGGHTQVKTHIDHYVDVGRQRRLKLVS